MPFSPHGIPSMSSSHFNIQSSQQQMSHKYDQQFHQRSEDMIHHSSYHHNMARLNISSPLLHQSTQNPLSHSPQSLSAMSQSTSIYTYDPTNVPNYPSAATSSNDTYQFNNYTSGNSGNFLHSAVFNIFYSYR